MRVRHQAIKLRALVFATANTNVAVGIDQTPAARLGELLNLAGLEADILPVISG